MATHLHIKNFVSEDELQKISKSILANENLFKCTYGKASLGPRYKIIDGDQIQSQLPEIYNYGEERVKAAVEQFSGKSVKLFFSSKRAIRVQVYAAKDHGFRWHFDGHSFAAILTLSNTNKGQTQFISEKLSQFLKIPLYALYPFPQIFSLMPYESITSQRGDLLIIRGQDSLHRGITLEEEGERAIIIYTYDEVGKKPSPIRDKIARFLNY